MKRPVCVCGLFWFRLALQGWHALAIAKRRLLELVAALERSEAALGRAEAALQEEWAKRVLVEAREVDLERREAAAAEVIQGLRDALGMYGGAAHFTSPSERGAARVRALRAAADFMRPVEVCHGGH